LLMQIVVEPFALRIDALQPVALEGAEQFALGGCDALQHALGARVGDLGFGQGLDRAPQVVGGRQQILGEAGHRIFLHVVALALHPAADVFGLGQRAQ